MRLKAILLFLLITIASIGYSADKRVLRHNIKSTFLSWYTGSEKITYEQSLSTHLSSEFTVGIIGLINDAYNNNPKGYTIRYAQKYIFSQNDVYALNGPYIKAELILSNFRYENKESKLREHSNMGALFAIVGYQIANRAFTFDFCVGAGGAVGKPTDTHYQHGFVLYDLGGHYREHLALTFEMKIGYSF